MPNTTNYSFPTPADTDLVKNGADAIRDLGDAVDTAMNTALGTKKAGMVLLSSVAFSAVSSQSVNTVFNSTYDNYLVTCFFESTATDTINFRLRLSGTDNSTSNYNYQELRAEGVNVVGARVTGASTYKLGVMENNNRNYFNLWLSNVAKAQNTIIVDEFVRGEPSLYFEKGAHLVATAFDGFTLLPASGNITGSVSVYGINK